MIGIINSIKKRAIGLQQTTSVNDNRYEGLRDIVELCDELLNRCTDDGR